MADIDVLYVTWNRLEFTRFSFEQLLANTDWNLVDRLVVWDDYSTDGTLDYLRETIPDSPVPYSLHVGGYRSVVSIMNRYVAAYESPLFAKIDNDIVVPPGWLNDMAAVMDDCPGIELLGMQASFTGVRGPDPDMNGTGDHTFQRADHIGGVGLMRRDAFTSRPKMHADGRFGFTHWQEHHEPSIGWITPDIDVTCLDQIPFEPWRSLSLEYCRRGWQRAWEPYPADHYAWQWWPESMKERA